MGRGSFSVTLEPPLGFQSPRICRLCGVLFFPPIDTTAADRDTEAPKLPPVSLEGGGPFPVAPSFLPPGFRPEKLVLSSDVDETQALEALRAMGYEPLELREDRTLDQLRADGDLESSLDVEEEGPVTPSLETPRLGEEQSRCSFCHCSFEDCTCTAQEER